MKYNVLLFVFTFFYGITLSQNTFKITLSAPEYSKDSLFIGIISNGKNINNYYDFSFNSNSQIKPYGKFNGVFIKISKEKAEVIGNAGYPQPIGFGYINKTTGNFQSEIFFLEKGNYDISLKNIIEDPKIYIQTPANLEHETIKKIISGAYTKPKKFSSTDSTFRIKQKHEILKNYIKKNTNSYVALWEIILDYNLYGYNDIFLKNLNYFSKELQLSKPYITLKNNLEKEKATSVGSFFPEIILNKEEKLGSENFKNHPYTLIYYWAKNCSDCFKNLSELSKIYDSLKSNGLNIISITGSKRENPLIISKILRSKNAEWKNMIDYNDAFPTQLLVTKYSMIFLVNSKGKIIMKENGNLYKIEKYLREVLK